MREIQVYNTLSGKKEKLETIDPNHVKMYACGVTVYDNCHIGHAMQAIYFDVIRNYLEFAGYKVTYVRNYTDVDDKIIARSQLRGITPKALVDEIIASSEQDMAALGVRAATHEPRVSESIPEIITMIQDLEKNGFAYSTKDGDVYYRVRKKADYGKLSNRKLDELQTGTRDNLVHGDKEDEMDFALWKNETVEGATWDSPWGKGRPGWHIECSAMAKKYLGSSFDIHGGGLDLVFPHHENEIAQSEAANGCKYANCWMHSGLLTISKQKMSKSLGNHILIQDFLKRFPGEVLRLAYLQNHYSSNVDFSEQVFRSAAKRLLYFYETLKELDALAVGGDGKDLLPGHAPAALLEAFHKEMTHDFGSVGALRELLSGTRKANELRQGKKSPQKANTALAYAKVLRELFAVFGLLKREPNAFIQELKRKILADMKIEEATVLKLIADRKAAREGKDFARADQIRLEVAALGLELMDGTEGTTWTIQWKED